MSLLRRANFGFCIRRTFKQLSPVSHGFPFGVVVPACANCGYLRQEVALLKSVQQPQHRYQHMSTVSRHVEMSGWQKFKWNIGLRGKLQFPEGVLALSGFNLYICCTDFIDFAEFVRVVNLPDTFTSWFLLLQLHMWMVNVKLSQMDKEGILLKQYMYQAMWTNVQMRLDKFKDLLGSEKRKALCNYHSDMIMSILYYDEGMADSDKKLANNLWVQLFAMDPSVAADKLELMVEYVRKQVCHHDRLDPYLIMKPGYIPFLPLTGDKLDQNKSEKDLNVVLSHI